MIFPFLSTSPAAASPADFGASLGRSLDCTPAVVAVAWSRPVFTWYAGTCIKDTSTVARVVLPFKSLSFSFTLMSLKIKYPALPELPPYDLLFAQISYTGTDTKPSPLFKVYLSNSSRAIIFPSTVTFLTNPSTKESLRVSSRIPFVPAVTGGLLVPNISTRLEAFAIFHEISFGAVINVHPGCFVKLLGG